MWWRKGAPCVDIRRYVWNKASGIQTQFGRLDRKPGTLYTLLSPFSSFMGWFWFCGIGFFDYSRIKGKQSSYLYSPKSTLIITYIQIKNQNTNLQNYTFVHITLYFDANLDGKWCLTASKLIKESENIFFVNRFYVPYCLFYANK